MGFAVEESATVSPLKLSGIGRPMRAVRSQGVRIRAASPQNTSHSSTNSP